ncbi:RNA polymerase rpb2, domain 7 domain-containing protein [Ditylenchus destructor]|nr:RNA polymerase rpb2, domain 7 domain-containing protein [Ditylenchus destructor]
MIADKFQVRATGPVDPVTLQPVKGRKMGGGDRLFNCSDKDEAYMCANCGSLVSVAQLRPHMAISRKIESAFHKHNATIKDTNFHNAMKRHCTVCKRDDQVFLVQIPRVFRYLCAELSSVNVKVQLGISHPKNLKH